MNGFDTSFAMQSVFAAALSYVVCVRMNGWDELLYILYEMPK